MSQHWNWFVDPDRQARELFAGMMIRSHGVHNEVISTSPKSSNLR
jgi:hypothetical protein